MILETYILCSEQSPCSFDKSPVESLTSGVELELPLGVEFNEVVCVT